MTDEKGFWVYAVVYSNYEPPEVGRLYATRELAVAAREEINEEARNSVVSNSDNWEIKQMWVHTS